ncbi:MAG: class I SAM-dependent DNA methyltransferase [Candidatus Thorarchaeota archaeon]
MRHDSRYQLPAKEPRISSRAHKKSTGSYYTPEYLADLIAQDSIFTWISNQCGVKISSIDDIERLNSHQRERLVRVVRKMTILDPAVGDGVFLVAAGELLFKILGILNLEQSKRNTIVKENLYGVDLAEYAISSCVQRLANWSDIKDHSALTNLKIGNTLVGSVGSELLVLDGYVDDSILNWNEVFPEIFQNDNCGFDIILGNPPYGNILGPVERQFISKAYPFTVWGGRNGTWNSAAHFLVRALSLLKTGGQLGFLVPNSILRVKQFSKTREFLLNKTKLWKIVDEGSPFDDVTLEMISLFCEKTIAEGEYNIKVESRRLGLEQSNQVSSSVFKESKVFSIYHDHILKSILKRGRKGLLIAGRGRDIPKDHVKKQKTTKFTIPYITSGRSVRRYMLKAQHISYTDDWYEQDAALRESFGNELLVATKNYRYPRCIIKPKGMLHGGGIVRITPLYKDADLRVLGLILNSKLVKQIAIRYLTNYSQLTCCLNTGIMEELPLVLPNNSGIYRGLFDMLADLYSETHEESKRYLIHTLENFADALVYSLYLGDNNLEKMTGDFEGDLLYAIQDDNIVKLVDDILNSTLVKELDLLGELPTSRKLRRY